jgi:hypothetical protein
MRELHYNVTGERRKALATAISEILGKNAVYLGAPTFSYQVGFCTISKEGTVTFSTPVPAEAATLREKLQTRGFAAVEPVDEPDQLTVEMPREGFSEDAYCKLQMIIRSKEKLLKKAIGTDTLEIQMSSEKIFFPWFTLHGQAGEADAYTRLVAALCDMAKNITRVTARERDVENEKFTFRLFLIRLGFVGAEYKMARKILLQNLSGNSSWKSGHPPIR